MPETYPNEQPLRLQALLRDVAREAERADAYQREAEVLRSDVDRLTGRPAAPADPGTNVSAMVTAVVVALVAGILLVAMMTVASRRLEDERDLRRHACHELALVGADADSGADVEACTFPGGDR